MESIQGFKFEALQEKGNLSKTLPPKRAFSSLLVQKKNRHFLEMLEKFELHQKHNNFEIYSLLFVYFKLTELVVEIGMKFLK